MKKLVYLLLFGLIINVGINSPVFAQGKDYEKYGRIATTVVREDYPGEELVEYEYVGREEKSENQVTDTFRFEVLENGKPKFIKVIITHNIKNDKTLTLSVEEEPKQ